MLTDKLLDFLGLGRDKLLGSLDSTLPAVPGWVNTAPMYVEQIMAKASQLDAWVPVTEAAVILAVVPVAVLAGLSIKVARIAVSFATAGGGSAG